MRKSPFLEVAVSAVVIAAPVIGLAAPAGADTRPAVTVTGPSSTVTTNTTTVTYSANRGGNQLAVPGGLTCALTGPTTSSDCGTPPPTTSKGTTTGSVSLTGLTSGTYSYTVTIVLEDGGTATNSATFTVNIAVAPCWQTSGNTHGLTDLKLTGPLGTLDNGTDYVSNDGSCSAGIVASVSIALGKVEADVDPFCVNAGYAGAYNLNSLGYAAAPANYWVCHF